MITWMPIITTVLFSGIIMIYCRTIDKRLLSLDEKVSKIPLNYVMKEDYNKNRNDLMDMLTTHRTTLDSINNKVGYFQGIQNGKKLH